MTANARRMRMAFALWWLLALAAAATPVETLRERAAQAHSDALVVLRDGAVIEESYFGKPVGKIQLMSCTKSLLSLAIGRLHDSGKLRLDQPLGELYPEWNQGRKRQITIRHLLNHTSGLQCAPTTQEIYASPDFVQLALAAELSDDPGTRFNYNNKAVALLSGVVARASGQRLDEYMRAEFFEPMDIRDYDWMVDRAGTPHGFAGLALTARDFAKFGQLMLDGGMWEGRRLLSQAWLEESLRPGPLNPSCGLLWWLSQDGGYGALGYLGQFLVVLPKQRLVGVRLVRASDSYDKATDGFQDFGKLLRDL